MKISWNAKAAFTFLLFSASLTAATVTYTTDSAGTGFGGSGLLLNSTSGAAASLVFDPNAITITGIPSNVNFGNFTLACFACSTQSGGSGSAFSAFTFNLVIQDIGNGATGMFVGSSTGGTVFSDVSQITVNWAPLVLGPGTLNALTGNFGTTIFSTTIFTGIVAPNSGSGLPNGVSTVQGYVSSSEVPEPSTFALAGLALVGLGLFRRKGVCVSKQ